MLASALHDDEIKAMLTEALAQYRAHPDDYLEGVVLGLMRVLDPHLTIPSGLAQHLVNGGEQ